VLLKRGFCLFGRNGYQEMDVCWLVVCVVWSVCWLVVWWCGVSAGWWCGGVDVWSVCWLVCVVVWIAQHPHR
jgi:hypothetical protein